MVDLDRALVAVLRAIRVTLSVVVTGIAALCAVLVARFVTSECGFHPMTIAAAVVLAGVGVIAAGTPPIATQSVAQSASAAEGDLTKLIQGAHASAALTLSSEEKAHAAALAQISSESAGLLVQLVKARSAACCACLSAVLTHKLLEKTIFSPLGSQALLACSAAATIGGVALQPPGKPMAGVFAVSTAFVQIVDVLSTLPGTIRSFAPATARLLAGATHHDVLAVHKLRALVGRIGAHSLEGEKRLKREV